MNVVTFVARPVEVDAIKWTGSNLDEIKAFCNGMAHKLNGKLSIETLEGTITAAVEDWIVRGTHGEFYPVKPHIMEKKYKIKE